MNQNNAAAPTARREFLCKSAAVGVSAVVILVPAAAGLATLLDPLRRKGSAGSFLRVANFSSLPEDGTPREIAIVADRRDAWNKFPQVRVGAIYLRRTGPDSVEALNVVCPHAGCFVNYLPAKREYLCPCHNSLFALNGAIQDPKSPTPRPLDSLETKIINDEVWVKFENFRAGTREKIPLA
jgi:menaquinol-cytochrome c reductase iron-sulfur subunit